MSGLFQKLLDTYRYALSQGDPRTEDWFFMDSFVPTAIIMGSYVVLIVIGLQVMKNRKPWTLRSVLVPYNLFLVLLSVYLCHQIFHSAIESKYNIICQGVEKTSHPRVIRMASLMWWFHISKILELMDTMFLILRKKNSQVTFLHCYHHFTMVCNTWLSVKYAPGGQNFFIALLNSFVHVIMYSYYGLAALGPHMQKHLWWKRHLTHLQLIQFFAMSAHILSGVINDCGYPIWYGTMQLCYVISLIILFTNFYMKAYLQDYRKSAALANGEIDKTSKQYLNGKID
ncbi:very long chain fatty acid elongase 4-like isoform X1 [Tachypleus tridentatus]|uniref:very long chain fatty acid elongase 4-like isoform X1 n=2 Tax=Tachypleus tridentatus TaxID=6853 RepID=UPI003FD45E87